MDLREKKELTHSSTRHPWELARVEVVLKLLASVGKLEGKTILDVGCGDTFLIETLSQKLPSTYFYAIDIAFTTEDLINYQKQYENTNIHVFQSLEDATQAMTAPADVILLLDVIEHIEDDVQFLRALGKSQCTTQDTLFTITVPAFQSLFCAHDTFLGHFRRYNNSSLQHTLQQAGMQTLQLGYFFSSLLPIRILQVLKEKLTPTTQTVATTGLAEWTGGSTKTHLIKKTLLIDFKITSFFAKIGIKILGLSNFALCKKAVS